MFGDETISLNATGPEVSVMCMLPCCLCFCRNLTELQTIYSVLRILRKCSKLQPDFEESVWNIQKVSGCVEKSQFKGGAPTLTACNKKWHF